MFRSWSISLLHQTPSSLANAGLRDREVLIAALEVLAAVSVAAVRDRYPCSRGGDICDHSFFAPDD